MKIEWLPISYLVSLAVFLAGIRVMGMAASKAGGILAALGLSLATAATLLMYKDQDGEAITAYPFLLGLLIAALALSWIIALKRPSPKALPGMVNLVCLTIGVASVLVVIHRLNYIIDTGIVFPADPKEELPGFVFIFTKFGHADVLLMVVGLAIGCIAAVVSMIGFTRLAGKLAACRGKWKKPLVIALLLMLVGYIIFVVYNTPIIISSYGFTPTTTDGTKAYSGLYDQHRLLIYGTLVPALLCALVLAVIRPSGHIPILNSMLYLVGGLVMLLVGLLKFNTSLIFGGIMISTGAALLLGLLRKFIKG
ncbi:MAG: NAD(P)(+) transhydrogenase (Re/Si-specific) subunit beta [Chitinophagaceae bacterium]